MASSYRVTKQKRSSFRLGQLCQRSEGGRKASSSSSNVGKTEGSYLEMLFGAGRRRESAKLIIDHQKRGRSFFHLNDLKGGGGLTRHKGNERGTGFLSPEGCLKSVTKEGHLATR